MTTGTQPRPMHPLRRALTLWGAVLAAMWLLLIIDWLTPGRLTDWGIVPRQAEGLFPGLIAAPLLHANAAHLVANTVPLAVMGTIAALRDWRACWIVLAAATVVSGLGVWLTSPAGTVTVGASGVVFGLFGYLLGRGVFIRRLGDIAIAILLIIVYGSMIWGIFPTAQKHISWQAHLFGFIGGLGIAFALARRTRSTTTYQ